LTATGAAGCEPEAAPAARTTTAASGSAAARALRGAILAICGSRTLLLLACNTMSDVAYEAAHDAMDDVADKAAC